jgi:cyclophilin family peptidyl-prolyl cis-trans isomerase
VKRSITGLALALVLVGGSVHAQSANPQVAVNTSKGRIVLELDAEKAPLTVANFLSYVDDGFFSATIFHRVIKTFMIQGGGFTTDLEKKETQAPIENEANNGLTNDRGTIAMARTGDPHSATAQFFINTVDNAALDYPGSDGWGYAVFGRVIEGLDVVDAIADVATGISGGMRDVPREAVVIESVDRVE